MKSLIIALFTVFSFVSHAQLQPPPIEFPKTKIEIAGKTLEVEVAKSHAERERGLMFRKSLPENSGMIFIFENEQPLAFWMKNTLIPLQIGYFDGNRKLVDLQEMVPAPLGDSRPRSYPSKKPAMYALEMNKGWFTKNNIKLGTQFTFIDPIYQNVSRPLSK